MSLWPEFLGFKDVLLDLLQREEVDYIIHEEFSKKHKESIQWISFKIDFWKGHSRIPHLMQVLVWLNPRKRGFLVQLTMLNEHSDSVGHLSFMTSSAYDLVKVIFDTRLGRIDDLKEWAREARLRVATDEDLEG